MRVGAFSLAGFVGLHGLISVWLAGCETAGPSPDGPANSDALVDASYSDGNEASPSPFVEDADILMRALAFAQDELIVHLEPGAEIEDIEAASSRACATVSRHIQQLGVAIVGVSPGGIEHAAASLAASPLIGGVQKNYYFDPARRPNDPQFGAQGYLESVSLPQAWDASVGSEQIVIAVLDTGVAADHPDLAGKVMSGWSTFEGSNDTSDVAGHGTAVAGVAAALTDNETGIAGASWLSPIMPVRVTNSAGQASSLSIATGMIWAAEHGARVINVSFASLGADRIVHRAAGFARSAGALVFASTGNDGIETSASGSPNMIFVGAVDGDNQIASFSTRGPLVNLAAPGTDVVMLSSDGGYATGDGTSFASPIGAATAALVWSLRPSLRPTTVQDILFETAKDLGAAGKDDSFGYGLIDARRAVDAAGRAVEIDDTTAPTTRITSPAGGDVVSEIMVIEVAASDDGTIADVVLYLDGYAVATDTEEPYAFAVNTRRLAVGPHTLQCRATDASGNSGLSQRNRIEVAESTESEDATTCDANAPTILFGFPDENTTVTSRVAIQVTAADDGDLAKLEWFVDGLPVRTTRAEGNRVEDSLVWDATTVPAGSHVITVRATDLAGNEASAGLGLVKQ